MRKRFLALASLLAATTATLAAQDTAAPRIGVVNFAQCVTDSKNGKKEQASFESLKNQMTALIEETENQLKDLSTKLNDQEYMESLSKEAQEELANKFRGLSDEMGRYQNQYYQVLNQANMRLLQNLHSQIQDAAKEVANQQKLDMVINKEAFFFHQNQYEVTNQVIDEMNRRFEIEQVAAAETVENKN